MPGSSPRHQTSPCKKRPAKLEPPSSSTTSNPPTPTTTTPLPSPLPSLTDRLHVWKQLISDDPDAEYLLEGIEHGFILQDSNAPTTPPPHPHPPNYRSTRSKEFHSSVEETISTGLRDGLFSRLDTPPPSTSPLSAVPKSSGGVRVIHDLSSPVGHCLNSFSSKDEVKFQTVEDAVRHITPNCYLAKVDLKSAYRSVKTHPSSWPWATLYWEFENETEPTFLQDTRLPFGARRSPAIFHRITQAVRRSLINRGFPPMVVYVDDFLIIAPTAELCATALSTLIATLRALGFMIAWDKVEGPTQRLTFLGVEINTTDGTLTLNAEKRSKLIDFLKTQQKRKRLSRKQLQSLAGRLSWASAVIPWGRLHVRSLFDQLATVKADHHKIPISNISDDIQWWLIFLNNNSHCRHIWDSSPKVTIHCDASQNAGGAFCMNDWFYTAWSADLPFLTNEHINVKELAIAVAAIFQWAPLLHNRNIVIATDNTATLGIINKGTSPAPAATRLLRPLSALAIHLGSTISAVHIPGHLNHIPDAISRMHCQGHLSRLGHLLYEQCFPFPKLEDHMTKDSLAFLLRQIAPLQPTADSHN